MQEMSALEKKKTFYNLTLKPQLHQIDYTISNNLV